LPTRDFSRFAVALQRAESDSPRSAATALVAAAARIARKVLRLVIPEDYPEPMACTSDAENSLQCCDEFAD
jgi:hypothetical protein